MKGDRKIGWLEPGDTVQAGDFKVLKTGEWAEMKGLGFQHKAHHMPVWRPAAKTPTRDERKAMLAVAKEQQDRRFDQGLTPVRGLSAFEEGIGLFYETHAQLVRRDRDNRDQVEEDRRWSEANGFPDVGG